MKNAKKSIFAIIVGFLVVFILSTITDIVLTKVGILPSFPQPLFDTALLLLALSYRTLYTVFGGYITAKLAPEKKLTHVLILGTIGIIAGSIGAIIMQAYGPLWYSWGLVVLSLPSVYTGFIVYTYQASHIT
jgi:hypothetical protein